MSKSAIIQVGPNPEWGQPPADAAEGALALDPGFLDLENFCSSPITPTAPLSPANRWVNVCETT